MQQNHVSKEMMMKITDYINHRYGSVCAFKLLKYFLEHQLAREIKGIANYEVAFHIAPSEVLTRSALVKIECRADGAQREESETGFNILLEKGILKIDAETGIVELAVPIESIADVYLQCKDGDLEAVSDRSSADIILLQTVKAENVTQQRDDSLKINMAGVPDILYRNSVGSYTLVEIKLYSFES